MYSFINNSELKITKMLHKRFFALLQQLCKGKQLSIQLNTTSVFFPKNIIITKKVQNMIKKKYSKIFVNVYKYFFSKKNDYEKIVTTKKNK